MIEIQYSSLDYVHFVETVASKLHRKAKGNVLHIPSPVGTGFMRAENFDNGMSLLAADMTFSTDILFHRAPIASRYFIMQFDEFFKEDNNEKKINGMAGVHKNSVFVNNTFTGNKFLFHPGERIRTVNILFEKKHLLQFMDNATADNFLSLYFSEHFKNKTIEPVDAEYRILINELVKEKIDQPLKHVFMQNRALLLIERFIIKFSEKMQTSKVPLKFSEEAIMRLMKIEALLIRDFSEKPPVIETLSRLSSIGPTKLKRDFRLLYGLPIYEYYQKNRMKHAKSLLLTKEYTVREVGNMVGYKNHGHFAASFKKEFGLLPSELNETSELPDSL